MTHPNEKMRKITLILLCLVMTFFMAACGKKAEPKREPKREPEGELIMQAVDSPSPLTIHFITDDSEEQVNNAYKLLTETYEIYSSGDVCYKEEVVRLKDKDLDAILERYDRFCRGNVSIENYVICDLGESSVIVYGADHYLEYEYGACSRCKEVAEVLSIVYPYFKHPSIWETIGAEE